MSIEIKAFENGPFVVGGRIAYRKDDGEVATTAGGSAALCRCGATAREPFCDGTHNGNGFRAVGFDLTIHPAEQEKEEEEGER